MCIANSVPKQDVCDYMGGGLVWNEQIGDCVYPDDLVTEEVADWQHEYCRAEYGPGSYYDPTVWAEGGGGFRDFPCRQPWPFARKAGDSHSTKHRQQQG